MAGATTGGIVGGTIGAFTGPGAIVTGTVGAIGGAVSGLLEAGAEDLGFGAGTQFAAGMITPGAGLSTKVGQMIEKKASELPEKNFYCIAAHGHSYNINEWVDLTDNLKTFGFVSDYGLQKFEVLEI